jgi:AraC-like DNA-binding protein
MDDVNGSVMKRRTVSAREFSDASLVFCDRYALLDQPLKDDGHRLFTGRLYTQAMSSGVNVSLADIVALRDSDHAVTFPRSLSLVFSLEGRPSEVNAGKGREKIVLQPGEAALFSFSDEEETRGRYSAGHCSKSILLQLRPGMMADEGLAHFVERQVRSSEMIMLGNNRRLNALSGQFFKQKQEGTVGRLLTESCALELVARTLQVIDGDDIDPVTEIRPGDRARMARVRDMIIDDPGAPHSLQSLSREAGLSISGLKTKFRQVYGQPVFAFVHGVRMETARFGLEREGWTVAKAAHFAGYNHASNFSTAYLKHFGYSPGRAQPKTM